VSIFQFVEIPERSNDEAPARVETPFWTWHGFTLPSKRVASSVGLVQQQCIHRAAASRPPKINAFLRRRDGYTAKSWDDSVASPNHCSEPGESVAVAIVAPRPPSAVGLLRRTSGPGR